MKNKLIKAGLVINSVLAIVFLICTATHHPLINTDYGNNDLVVGYFNK